LKDARAIVGGCGFLLQRVLVILYYEVLFAFCHHDQLPDDVLNNVGGIRRKAEGVIGGYGSGVCYVE